SAWAAAVFMRCSTHVAPVYLAATNPAARGELETAVVGVSSFFILLLLPALLLVGTAFADWAVGVARYSVMAALRCRSPRVLFVVVLCVGLAELAVAALQLQQRYPDAHPLGIVAVALLCGMLAAPVVAGGLMLLARLGRIGYWPDLRVPLW